MSKASFKNMVEKACRKKDEEDMKLGMVGVTTMEGLINSDCKLKEYMIGKSLHNAGTSSVLGLSWWSG